LIGYKAKFNIYYYNMYKTYVISLNSSNELLEKISNYGLDPILIEGVNGKLLDNETIKKNTNITYAYVGPKSAIGCAMSHIKTWKEFLKTDAEYAIILEDDVVFVDDFKTKLDTICEFAPKDYDILYLGCFGCDGPINIFTYASSTIGLINLNSYKLNEYINKPVVAFATHSYIVSRKGAKKLLHYIEGNISNHIDFQINTLITNNKINVYALNKRIVFQTSTDETQSTNSSTNHPMMLNNILSELYVDKKVKASYMSTLSIFRLNELNLTLVSFMFILLGVFLSSTNIDFFTITIFYLLISIPDIYTNIDNPFIKLHYLFLIIPYMLLKYFDVWQLMNIK